MNNNSNKFTVWNEDDSNKEEAVRNSILPLSAHDHKGSQGRVVVLGGSERYTGAPYYAAMAALRTGADLATVFTAQEAATPLKTYSPELMVQAVYSAADCSDDDDDDDDDNGTGTKKSEKQLIERMVSSVTDGLERTHCLVIGPGMGRNRTVMKAVAAIIQKARQDNLYMVLDADALFLLAQPEYRGILKGYDRAILTPNVVEYKRLMNVHGSDSSQEDNDNNPFESVTIVEKGRYDKILVNGTCVYTCQEPGGLKRAGGIGDVLSGAIGTLVAWHCILSQSSETNDDDKKHQPLDLQLACWTACCLVKRATKRAFAAKRRAMSATDVLAQLGATLEEMTN